MSETVEIAGVEIPKSDWEATPASVKASVMVLSDRISHIEEQLKQNSQNSSRPPSSDTPGKQKDKQSTSVEAEAEEQSQKKQKRPRGRGKGSKGFGFYAEEACAEVVAHIPSQCAHCGEALKGRDAHPQRHQVIDIPKLEAWVVEHQLHEVACECCGGRTRASLPKEVSASGYGDRLVGLVGLLSSAEHRQSHSMVCGLMEVLFGIKLSRSGVNQMRQQVSESVATAVEQAHSYVKQQAAVNSDETGFTQRNRDGKNPEGRAGWL